MQRRYRKKRPQQSLTKRFRVNDYIRSPEVFVIDQEGNQLGVMPTTEAVAKAREVGFDLIEVSPKANPPVARLADYGQFKYEQEKKVKKQKQQQKKTEVKGIRLSFRIKGQDLDIRVQQALKFLTAGHHVKIDLNLRGREKAHANKAIEVVNEFIRQLGDDIRLLDPVKRQGSRIGAEVTKK